MTLTQIYGLGHFHAGLTQMWSLAVEVAFYLILPVLAWALCVLVCRRGWHPGRLVGALCAVAAVTPAWVVFTHSADIDYSARLWLPGFLAWFAGGMVLTVAAVTIRRVSTPLLLLGAVAAYALSCTPAAGEATIIPQDAGAAITKSFLYLAFSRCLLAPLVIGSDGGGLYGRALSHPAVVWLGEISYELFLVHLVVMELVMDLLGYSTFQGSVVGVFIVTTVLSIPIAWVLHRSLEWVFGLRDRRQERTSRAASRAIASSSFVGTTSTATEDESAEIRRSP